MSTAQVVWAPWMFKLLDEINKLPFIDGVEVVDDIPEDINTDLSIKIKLSPGMDVSRAISELAEVITRESWEEYIRTGKLPTLYWEV